MLHNYTTSVYDTNIIESRDSLSTCTNFLFRACRATILLFQVLILYILLLCIGFACTHQCFFFSKQRQLKHESICTCVHFLFVYICTHRFVVLSIIKCRHSYWYKLMNECSFLAPSTFLLVLNCKLYHQ